MQTMPQMAMPQGGPTQSGLGALAAQMQQNGQADPRLMSMMQAFQNQGGMPGSGMMPPGPQVGQPPSGFGAFMQQRQQQDAMNAQRAMQSGTMPQFQDQMRQRDMAMQGITQADIDRMRNLQMSGDPSFQAESDALNARANANRMTALLGAQGGMPGMAAPGGGLLPGAQRPLPVGAGGKGTGMPSPMTTRPAPKPMVNPPRPMTPTPRPTPRPVTPRPAGFTGFR